MNPMQIMAMLQNSGNPMMMLTQLAQQNPMMSRAMQMGQGKNEVQLKETVRNLARQRRRRLLQRTALSASLLTIF